MDVSIVAPLLGLLATASMLAGVWLLLHLTALASLLAGVADIVASPRPPYASRAQVIAALAIFNLGWMGALLIWFAAID